MHGVKMERRSKQDEKFRNVPDIEGEAPDGRKYKFTDKYKPEFSRIEREAKGLPEKSLEELEKECEMMDDE